MRTITTEKTVYSFNELSESAKENARDWYRNGNLDYDWWQFVYDDAVTIGAILGIEIGDRPVRVMNGKTWYKPDICFQGFYSQGDNSSFSGSYSYAKGIKKTIRSHAPQDTELHRIADELQALQSRCFYAVSARIDHGYRYGIIVSVDYDPPNYQSLPGDVEQEIEDLLKDFNSWIFSRLESEYEYLNSDQAVDESIVANEYEFDEYGGITQ